MGFSFGTASCPNFNRALIISRTLWAAFSLPTRFELRSSLWLTNTHQTPDPWTFSVTFTPTFYATPF